MSIILDFRLPEQILPIFGEGFCYQQIEGTLGVYYVDRSIQPAPSASQYLYRYIPQPFRMQGTGDLIRSLWKRRGSWRSSALRFR